MSCIMYVSLTPPLLPTDLCAQTDVDFDATPSGTPRVADDYSSPR